MSAIFGPVVQQGYVVPDVEEAITHWVRRGVGPFFVTDIANFPGCYDGEPIMAEMRAGFAYSGDQQIEVITPLGDHPSIYKDYLVDHPDGGLQHLAFWVDDIDAKLAALDAAGQRYKVWQRYGEPPEYKAHAYIDSKESPGVMIQLMAPSEFYDLFFGLIKAAAADWDGATDPVRMLDMSDGTPKAVPYRRPA